jgi:hypothetical protein
MARVATIQYISPSNSSSSITSGFNWGGIETSGTLRFSVTSILSDPRGLYIGADLTITGPYGTQVYSRQNPDVVLGAQRDILNWGISSDVKQYILTATQIQLSVHVWDPVAVGHAQEWLGTNQAGWTASGQYHNVISITFSPPTLNIPLRPYITGTSSISYDDITVSVNAQSLTGTPMTVGVVLSSTNTVPSDGQGGTQTISFSTSLSSSQTSTSDNLKARGAALQPNTLYYLRPFIINGGYVYGELVTQVTTAAAPTLSITSYADTTSYSSKVFVRADNLLTSTAAYGIVVSSSTNTPTVGNGTQYNGSTTLTAGANTGNFSLTGLTSQTTYYVRMFIALNGGSYIYGSTSQFSTLPPPSPSITSTYGLNFNNVGATITATNLSPVGMTCGLVYSSSNSNPTNGGSGSTTATFTGQLSTSSTSVSNDLKSLGKTLVWNTTYYLRAFVIDNGTYYYSSTTQVTTLDARLLTAQYKTATNVTTNLSSSFNWANVQVGGSFVFNVANMLTNPEEYVFVGFNFSGTGEVQYTNGYGGPLTIPVDSGLKSQIENATSLILTVVVMNPLSGGHSNVMEIVSTQAGWVSFESPKWIQLTINQPLITVFAPGAPTITSVTRANGQATIAFNPPANNGGATITSYRVTSSGGQTQTGSSSPITVTGLTNGASYTFTVTATNVGGTSSASATSSAVIPATTPGAPTITSVTRGNQQVTVAFNAPASNGGEPITVYTVTSSGGQVQTGSASPITVTGLTNGTSYTFTVTATNAVGISSASGASSAAKPATIPDAPTITSVTRGNQQVTVTFNAPASNGGEPITGYTVTSSGGQVQTNTGSPITVTGLTNGTSYTFTVVATNVVGSSSSSSTSSSVIPATTPGAPTITNVAIGDEQATITFTPPASNGGRPITSYTVTSSGEHVATGSSSPITITGLTNNTEYTFTVTATNEVGTSTASAPTAPVSYASTPDLPHIPVQVNFEVEITGDSNINVFGTEFVPPTNILTAVETLPVNALYDATTNKGLIELWEPSADPDNIYCQLANTNSSAAGGPNLTDSYKDTLKILARGIQKVLCRDIDCSQAIPFNDPKYGGAQMYTVQRDFGRLAIAVFAHYFFGHVDATTVISNDRQLIMNMLSLNNTTAGEAAAVDDTSQGHVTRYAQYSTAIKNEINNTPITSWTNQTGSMSDANLARRLVAAVVTKGLTGTTLKVSKVNDPEITAEADKKKELAWIVGQVVGQDATRLMNEDNTQRTRDIHQLLRFYPGDIIYMNIKLNMPTVSVGQGQRSDINQSVLESSYQQQNYTLKITLSERDATL